MTDLLGPATSTELLLPLRRLAADVDGLETAVRRATASWGRVAGTAQDAVLVLDGAGRVTALSPPAAALLGVSVATSTGRRLAELLSPVDFTAAAQPDPDEERALPPVRALVTGVPARGLVRLRRPDGELVTVDAVALPLARRAGVLAFLLPV